jgi:hypothetical protein
MPVVDQSALTPEQFVEMKKVTGSTYAQLQKVAGVSRARMSEFATGVGHLRPEQLAALEKVLRKAMVAHSERIARLVSGEAA